MKQWRKKYFNPAMHLLVWGLLIGIPAILIQQGPYLGLPPYFFPITAMYHAGIFYLNACFLYPRLLTKRFWWLYIISLAVVVLLSYHIKLYFLQLFPGFRLTPANRGVIAFGLLPFLVASIIFRLINDRLRYERLQKEARSEQLASELKFLRSQVSPHFLFNMMTNMVSLARQKSDLLEPSLIRLSDLLRYMLYESQKDSIPVANEIEHIKNYVDLQKLRFGDDINVALNISNESQNNIIEPMLLIPFIENAFKHGIGLQRNAYISIRLGIKDKALQFRVANNYSADNLSKDKNSGIGLVNVKNRLRLLYPDKYELAVKDENGEFLIQLNLNLS
jgi:sensor histidine kinase YesM